MPKQPQFHRPYEFRTDDELLAIARSLPYNDRLSERISWEIRVTHAYAEIGIRTVGASEHDVVGEGIENSWSED